MRIRTLRGSDRAPAYANILEVQTCAPLTQGLITCLACATEGAIAFDSSYGNNTGIWQGTPAFAVSPWGRAYGPFTDSNYVGAFQRRLEVLPTGTSPRTLSALIKFTAGSHAATEIAGWGDNAFDGCRFGLWYDSGAIGVECRNGASMGAITIDNDWHLLSAVFPPGATDITSAIIYWDGRVLPITFSLSKTINTNANAAAIGRMAGATGFAFSQGLVGGVWIWNRALSAAEQAQHFASPFGMLQPRRFVVPGFVAGATQTITPASPVGPNRNFANPVVAGPLTVPTLIGPRFVYSPAVTLQQTVTLAAAVAGPRSIPTTSRVAYVLVVSVPTTIGPRAVFSPTVSGGPQYINTLGVIGPRSIQPPVVIGGELALRIYLGGVDRTEFLSWGDSDFTIDSQDLGRWQATFALWQLRGVGAYIPQVGETFLVLDHGERIMAGCVTDVTLDRLLSTTDKLKFRVQAADKSAICDHRVIRGQTYAAGSDVVEVILQICVSALDGEGIDTSLIPPVGSFGTLSSDLVCNFRNVTSAFDDIAQRTGLVWWIDPFVRLVFSPMVDLPAAPFDLTEDSNNWRGPGGPETGGGLTVTWTTKDYYNALYCVSNQTIIPGGGGGGGGGQGAGVTETFVWTPDGPGISTITDSMGTRVAVGIVASAAIGAVQSLTVNGVSQTVVDFGAYNGQTPNPPDLLWFWGGPATGGTPGAQVAPVVLPTNGQTIVIQYTAAVTAAASLAQYGTALDPEFEGEPLGTCGSGRYEGVIQVQDISSQEELDAIAAAQLERIGGVPMIVSFQTDDAGLRPGQQINVNIPLSGVDNVDMLITAMHGVAIPPALATGYAFRWTVECRNNLDPGNWLKWYETLVRRTMNALPVPQFEDATFVVPAASTLSGGVNIANPYIVSRTGKFVEAMVVASEPPQHQDLILYFEVNPGNRLVSQVVMPAGTAPNQLIVVPASPASQFWLFAQEVVNVTAVYLPTGTGTPVRAAGVTAKLRWTM